MTNEEKSFELARGGTLTLRRVTPDDDGFLLSLYESTRDKELSQVEWPPGQRELFVRWQFDLQRKEYSSRFPDARYYILVVDGERVGRIWIGENDEQIRLLDITILPEYQNRGAGTLLLRWLMEEANQRQKLLRHMVFVLNDDAHRFYERLGFTMIDDLGGYKHMEYRGGLEDE
jgi:GNAT superfamily N-acetyltransferase